MIFERRESGNCSLCLKNYPIDQLFEKIRLKWICGKLLVNNLDNSFLSLPVEYPKKGSFINLTSLFTVGYFGCSTNILLRNSFKHLLKICEG